MRTLAPRLTAAPGRRVTVASDIARATKKPLSIYVSPEWRALMKQIVKERGRRCQGCGRTEPNDGKPYLRLFGDHVHELKDGGAPLDPGNVRLLCGACHSRKTWAEKRRREG